MSHMIHFVSLLTSFNLELQDPEPCWFSSSHLRNTLQRGYKLNAVQQVAEKHLHWSCNQPQAPISALYLLLEKKELIKQTRKSESLLLIFYNHLLVALSFFYPYLSSGLSSFPLSLSSLQKSQEPPSICQLPSGELTRPESWILPLNHKGYAHLVLKACSLPQHMPLSSLTPPPLFFALCRLSLCHLLAHPVACPPGLFSARLTPLLFLSIPPSHPCNPLL